MRRLYEPVYPGIYVRRAATVSAQERAQAAWLWSKRRGIVAGLSAAAMHGVKWIDPSEPAELIHDNRRPPPNLVVRTEMLLPNELVELDGIRVTTPARTAFDLGRHIRSMTAAVQRLDALANATDVKRVDVEAMIAAHAGARGIPRLLSVLPLVDRWRITTGDARSAGIDRGGPASSEHAISRIRRIWAIRCAPRHGVRPGEGRYRIRRSTALDGSGGAAARYRQAVRADGAGLADHSGEQRPAPLPARHLRGQSRERIAVRGFRW